MTSTQATFGSALPDHLGPIHSNLQSHLSISTDVANFLSERAALEKEYSQKLSTIASKFQAKREKKEKECCVGPEGRWREGEGERYTLQTALLQPLITSAQSEVSHHINLSDSLTQLSTSLTNGITKRQAMSSRHFSFAQHVLSDRDKVWSERLKAKTKYDELCHEVEVTRNKKEKAESHDKHKERAIKDFEAREEDMSNSKNLYLIAIDAANRSKKQFYQIDLPGLQDHFQTLLTLSNERLFSSLNKSFHLFENHHETLNGIFKTLITNCSNSFKPEIDQKEFIDANKKSWQEPPDWKFEPCVGFFDNPDPLITDSSKVFLQNKLLRCRKKLRELKPLVETKEREIAGLENLREAYERQEGLGDGDEVMENLLDSSRQLLSHQTTIALLETEIQSIIQAIGDDEGEARPHKFKPASFTIPTTCNFCDGTIWGIARQGFVCKPCGYTVHSKCEMKVPADCRSAPPTSTTSTSSSSNLARSPSVSTNASNTTGANSSINRSTSVANSSRMSENPKGKMVYHFDATSPFELSVKEGDVIELIEDDSDNCGWIKVKNGNRSGLVPTSYCDFGQGQGQEVMATDTSSSAQGQGQGCGKYIVALYDYPAADSEELSLVEGEQLELTTTGYEFGEGWVEAIKEGRIGIVPSNHVQAL